MSLDLIAREVSASSKRRRKSQISTRPPAAPLVDSSLLRFMSTQKKVRQKKLKDVPDTPTLGYLGSLMQATERLKDKISGATISEPDAVARTGDAPDSWLGQYNRQRVANRLLELGVEETAAYEAGEVVQSHVLTRTARRRVREFLKQRDVLWVNGESTFKQELSNSSLQVAQDMSMPPFPPYGLDDVVDMFLEFGLTGNDLAAIFLHTPSVVLMRPRRLQKSPAALESIQDDKGYCHRNGETLEETITRSLKVLLCGSLKLRKYDARKVLRTSPGLLTMKGSRSAEQVVNLLCTLGVSTKSIARDKNALPVMLSRSPSALFRLVAFLSSDAVRMPLKDIGPLIRRKECADLLDALAPVPRIEQARQKCNDAPLSSIWGRSSEERREEMNKAYQMMSSTAWTLRHEIGCAHLGKIISAYPNVLLLDAKKQILPTAQYLMNELGIWEDDLPRVLQLYPMLLGMDVSQMKEVASYLVSIEVEESALASIFRAFPSLLTLEVKKDMSPVVEFLSEIGVANIGRFVT